MNLTSAAQRLAAGESVSGHPVGNSMRPLVPSGARVVIVPSVVERLEVDDIVLVRVTGRVYLHKILAIDDARRRVQIGNNSGGVNGWTGLDKVFGICVEVDGVARPRLDGKTRHAA